MATTASQPTSGNAPAGAPAVPSAVVMLTEVPVSLKQLARLVVRGFYPVEEALIVDMLVRYPCVREEDLAGNTSFCRHNQDHGFRIMYTPQIVYRVTAYRVDSGYRVGFSWNQFILAISIVKIVLL